MLHILVELGYLDGEDVTQHPQCIGTENESHTCINAYIQFSIIETFMKLTVVLDSYPQFHTIEIHEGCSIISDNTVLTYFCLTDRVETFRTKRS